jgi:hypothetical protein
MNTAIAAIEEDINGARARNVVFRARKAWVRAMKNLVRSGDVVTVTASASGVMSGDLIGAATSPVFYLIGTAMKATGTLAAIVRVRLDVVAVVAAGA